MDRKEQFWLDGLARCFSHLFNSPTTVMVLGLLVGLYGVNASGATNVVINAPQAEQNILTSVSLSPEGLAGLPRESYERSTEAYLIDSQQHYVYANETLLGLGYYGITFQSEPSVESLVAQGEELIYLGLEASPASLGTAGDTSTIEVNLQPEVEGELTNPVSLVLASPNISSGVTQTVQWTIQGHESVDLKKIYFVGGESASINLAGVTYAVQADSFVETPDGVLIAGLPSAPVAAYSNAHFGLGCEEFDAYLIGAATCVDPSGAQITTTVDDGFTQFVASNELYAQTGLYLTSINASYFADSFDVTVGRFSGDYFALTNADNLSIQSATRYMANPANEFGYSFNELEQVYVDRPLEIINLPSYTEDADGNPIKLPAADRIVIEADEIKLFDKVTVVGPPTDLLFIKAVDGSTGGSAKIFCQTCAFDNVQRLTMAVVDATAYAVSKSGDEIVELKTAVGGEVVIDGLDAPGALALEVLSDDVVATGKISIHDRVAESGDEFNRDSDQGYMTIGSGTANFFIGDLDWDYNSRLLVGTNYQPGVTHIEGDIEASSVKLVSTRGLIVNGDISTISDMTSTITYQGVITTVEEGVLIQTLTMSTPLQVHGKIETFGFAELRAADDLTVAATAAISATDSKLFSVRELKNYGSVDSHFLSAGAVSIRNEGALTAAERIDLSADLRVLNQYGGEISGALVVIETDTTNAASMIRNGADRPYYETYEYDDVVANLTWSDEGGLFQWGRFYDLDNAVDVTVSNYVEAQKTSAHIYGGVVSMKTSILDNVNPYYEILTADVLADFNDQYVEQVLISAENRLTIDASDVIRNTSAMMTVNDSSGLLQLFSNRGIHNERYRIQGGLSAVEETIVEGETTRVVKEANAYLAAVSPGGVLRSLGDFEGKVTSTNVNHRLRNDFSYIEVLGDAIIDASRINLVGMTTEFAASDITTVANCTQMRFYRLCRPNTMSDHLRLEGYVDSLFYVHGDLNASSAALNVSSISVMDQFLQAAVEAIAVEDYTRPLPWSINDYFLDLDGEYIEFQEMDCSNPGGPAWTTYSNYAAKDTVTFERTQDGDDQLHITITNFVHRFTNAGTPQQICDDMVHMAIEQEHWVVDTMEALSRFYESAVDFLESIYNEINFWD